MPQAPLFHMSSGTVRFWVDIGAETIGASITKETLHYRYNPTQQDDDPLTTYTSHAAELQDAVRRRVATGAREPVMLREHDLPAR